MILKCINLTLITLVMATVSACSSSSGSSSDGTSVSLTATPSPANVAVMSAGSKTFRNATGEIILTKAYLVIASSTIETECGAFSAAADRVLNLLIPAANAHTTTTPTSTGEPYVIDLLAMDNASSSIGNVSPPEGDFCGVNFDLLAADDDTNGLPTDIDMVGKTLYIEGTYTLDAGGSGSILIDTGAGLNNRELLLSALVMISDDNLDGVVNIGINYDTWFDSVDLSILENEVVPPTDISSEGFKVLTNVSDSIHQI